MSIFDALPARARDLFSNIGNTPPPPDPNTDRPATNESPRGGSGRAHFNGFIQFDELNRRLVGSSGLRVFDQMWRTDADVKRDVTAVWTPIQSAPLDVQPYGGSDATEEDLLAARFVDYVLNEFMFPNLRGHLAEVGPVLIRSGYVDFEQVWRPVTWEGKDLIAVKKLDLRLPRTIWKFYQDDMGDLTGIVQFLPNAANVWIPANDLLHYRLQAEGDNWIGTSLLRHCYKHWFFKEHFEKLDAIGQERKAVGVPIIYPPMGADEQTKEEVETIFANLHTNEVGYAMMPGPKAAAHISENIGWEVDIVTFDSSSDNGIRESIEYQTLKIAGAFIADFLELGHHQVGARATAEVQEDPFQTADKALGEIALMPLQALVSRIAFLNFPGIKGAPKLRFELGDDASLSELSAFAFQLWQAGMLHADGPLEAFFREKAQLPPLDPTVATEVAEADKASRQAAIQAPVLAAEAQEAAITAAGEPATPPAGGSGPAKPAAAKGPGGTSESGSRAHAPVDGDRATNIDKGKRDNPAKDPSKPTVQKLDAADGDPVGSAPWYEKLLSQGRLREALDNARDTMIASASPAAVKMAANVSARARGGRNVHMTPPDDLRAAIAAELHRLYDLGHATVVDEVTRHGGQTLTLDEGTSTGEPLEEEAPEGDEEEPTGAAGRRRRQTRRATIGAEHVTNETVRAAERAVVSGQSHPLAIQRAAEAAALLALRNEALRNASAAVNDGRAAAAEGIAAAPGAPDLRGIYTAVLDQRTCDPCDVADDGIERAIDDPALEVPNPECSGGEFCRCTVVYVVAGLGEGGAVTE